MTKWRPEGRILQGEARRHVGRGSHWKLAIIVFKGGFLIVVREGEGVSFFECIEEEDVVAFKGVGRGLPTSDLVMGR